MHRHLCLRPPPVKQKAKSAHAPFFSFSVLMCSHCNRFISRQATFYLFTLFLLLLPCFYHYYYFPLISSRLRVYLLQVTAKGRVLN